MTVVRASINKFLEDGSSDSEDDEPEAFKPKPREPPKEIAISSDIDNDNSDSFDIFEIGGDAKPEEEKEEEETKRETM